MFVAVGLMDYSNSDDSETDTIEPNSSKSEKVEISEDKLSRLDKARNSFVIE